MWRARDVEKAMLDGAEGKAIAKAMDLLVRYGEALGAERLVETNNVAGNINGSPAQREKFGGLDGIFSALSLDSDEIVEIPPVRAYSCQLIGPMDTKNWQVQGISQELYDSTMQSIDYNADHGIQIMSTCTPYQIGNVPVKGEICAWMESSAVVYINSVLGARTNVEGRESTAAAMLTKRIPYWGYLLDENRLGTHRINVEVDVESVMDWGLLGYWVGEAVQDQVPVLDGIKHVPNLTKLKHFGAAAASSGGVEMFHVPGITAEARTVEEAFGPKKPIETLVYGAAQRREAYDMLNSTATDTKVDLVMLGCPHANIEQIWEATRLLEGRHVAEGTNLWIFTPHPIRELADRNGYTKIIADAGGVLMSDTCPAIGRFLPKDCKVVAMDSAKQAHYLPAIMGIQGRFGNTTDCVNAAISGEWKGALS